MNEIIIALIGAIPTFVATLLGTKYFDKKKKTEETTDSVAQLMKQNEELVAKFSSLQDMYVKVSEENQSLKIANSDLDKNVEILNQKIEELNKKIDILTKELNRNKKAKPATKNEAKK